MFSRLAQEYNVASLSPILVAGTRRLFKLNLSLVSSFFYKTLCGRLEKQNQATETNFKKILKKTNYENT